jgi:AraC-like DNA-binding protein
MADQPVAPRASASPALIDFVLRHARVTANVCSLQVSEAGYRLAPRTVPDHNFIHVTRGEVEWVVEDATVRLVPGDLLLVPPGVRHRAQSVAAAVTLASLHVDVVLPGGQPVFDLLRPPRVQAVAPGSRLAAYWRGYIDEFEGKELAARRIMLEPWARLIVLELLGDNARRGRLEVQPVHPVVAEMLTELADLVDRQVTLDELAARSGFSAQHLGRLFRDQLGVTPLQYLGRLRMERAAELLTEGRLTVKAVARHLGFADPYYFSRAFKRHFGRSPSSYQRRGQSMLP